METGNILDIIRKGNGKAEIISILEEIDGMKAALAEKDREFAAMEKRYAGERAEIEKRLGSIESQFRDRQRRCEELRGQIPKEILK